MMLSLLLLVVVVIVVVVAFVAVVAVVVERLTGVIHISAAVSIHDKSKPILETRYSGLYHYVKGIGRGGGPGQSLRFF